jgi:DNA mismatch repair protein MutL
MILDQNAAHERILYERSLQNIQTGLGLSQQLLFPQTVEFGQADLALLQELMRDLRALGFDLELFGGRSVVVRGVPADIQSGDERTVLEDVLTQYKTNRERVKVGSRENLARSVARRSAIRPGTRLSPKEMRSLIDQLFACEMPYACPHGRSTIVKIPIEELDKRFSR